MPANLTLVIHLSAGDETYAKETASSLIQSHRAAANTVVLIVDTVQAQHSSFYNHKKRYQQPAYQEKTNRVRAIANSLKASGLADTVLDTADFDQQKLLKKYLQNRVDATHDFRGAPIAAYLLGFDVCKTRYMVRYDGDILLHQNPNEDWAIKGIRQMENNPDVVAVSPRTSPPAQTQFQQNGDRAYWFSTRCTLFDLQKISGIFPLARGWYRFELLARQWLNKTYPPAFESLLTRRLKTLGLSNYYQLEDEAWILHPEQKDEDFCKLLPQMVKCISKNIYPPEQAGNETLDLQAWKNLLRNEH